MTATCHICGKQWDTEDPGVRYWYGTGEWECNDEAECLARRSDTRHEEEVQA